MTKQDYIEIIMEYLKGSYNSKGVFDWFHRPRKSFDNKTPSEILNQEPWDQENGRKVLEFAIRLSSS